MKLTLAEEVVGTTMAAEEAEAEDAGPGEAEEMAEGTEEVAGSPAAEEEEAVEAMELISLIPQEDSLMTRCPGSDRQVPGKKSWRAERRGSWKGQELERQVLPKVLPAFRNSPQLSMPSLRLSLRGPMTP